MNGNISSSGGLALLAHCEILGHLITSPNQDLLNLSNEDDYPIWVLAGFCEDQMEMSKCDL